MNKKKIGLSCLVLLVAFGAGYFSKPSKIKTEIKEITKTVIVKEEAKTRIVYREKVTKSDGTITEKEIEKEETKTTENSRSDSSKTSNTEITNHSGITIQALAIVDVRNISGEREYGLYFKKRVFANISIGTLLTTDKKVGVGVGVDF